MLYTETFCNIVWEKASERLGRGSEWERESERERDSKEEQCNNIFHYNSSIGKNFMRDVNKKKGKK